MGNLLTATAYEYEVQVKDEVGNASALIAGSLITVEAPDSVPPSLLNYALPLDPGIESRYTVQVSTGGILPKVFPRLRVGGVPRDLALRINGWFRARALYSIRSF